MQFVCFTGETPPRAVFPFLVVRPVMLVITVGMTSWTAAPRGAPKNWVLLGDDVTMCPYSALSLVCT